MTLVSCVMPARGRQEWARLAVQCFLSQDYPAKELVILDDADDPAFPEGLSESGVRYHRTDTRMNVVDKRNAVNALANGDIIAHFDSDDWSDPTRLSRQVELMRTSQKALVGFHSMLFFEPVTQSVAKYIGARNYACGTTLLYRKSFWEVHPFSRPRLVDYGSDNIFVRVAKETNQLASVDAETLMVARVHPGNTSPTRMDKMNRRLSPADLPAGFPR